MNEITIDYNQDIQELMIQFYGALAKRDLTILCFRSHDDYPVICQTPSTGGTTDKNIYEGNYKVPSNNLIYRHGQASTESIFSKTITGRPLKTTLSMEES